MRKKLLASILALTMVLGLLPIVAAADDPTDPPQNGAPGVEIYTISGTVVDVDDDDKGIEGITVGANPYYGPGGFDPDSGSTVERLRPHRRGRGTPALQM